MSLQNTMEKKLFQEELLVNKSNSQYTKWHEIKLLKKIFTLFGNDNIFIVGGAVRNVLSNKSLEDIDLAVKFNSDYVKKKLREKEIKFIDLSKGHGTVSIISKGNQIEITSMRIDKETYGRKAKVEFVEDIFLDSCRRDFTINAMYLGSNGKIYDPHDGATDLKRRIVKFIGSPQKRIKEDRLRILRYFRFLSYYGCNKNIIHSVSMLACLKSIKDISKISKERRSYEFFKLIKGEYAADVLLLMKNKKILKLVLPGIEKIESSSIISINKLKKQKLIRLSFLVIIAKYNLDKLRENLFLKKHEFSYIKLLYSSYKLYDICNIKEARLVKYKLGREASIGLYYLKCIINKQNLRKTILKILQDWLPPDFPLDGNDLNKIGLKRGVLLGRTLKETQAWWIEKDFKPNKKQCLNKSRTFLINSKLL